MNSAIDRSDFYYIRSGLFVYVLSAQSLRVAAGSLCVLVQYYVGVTCVVCDLWSFIIRRT